MTAMPVITLPEYTSEAESLTFLDPSMYVQGLHKPLLPSCTTLFFYFVFFSSPFVL